jgi:hypothetical protein
MLMMTIESFYDFQCASIVSTIVDAVQLLNYYYCSTMKMFLNWNEHDDDDDDDDENVDRDLSAV